MPEEKKETITVGNFRYLTEHMETGDVPTCIQLDEGGEVPPTDLRVGFVMDGDKKVLRVVLDRASAGFNEKLLGRTSSRVNWKTSRHTLEAASLFEACDKALQSCDKLYWFDRNAV